MSMSNGKGGGVAVLSSLRAAVVVITGASSGIGRAAARAFAREGARLVLTARNREGLQATAGECALMGAHSLVVSADVTDATAMADLATKAVDAFGRIDVWINNAGAGLFGPFANGDVAAHRRVVEINLFGAMNGAAAVLPHFLRQHQGVMITTISIGGFMPLPFAAAYTAGKFGMRGFMAGLRQELAAEPGIRVCSIFPAVIDTPGFQHGANVSGVMLRPPWPIFPPESVAAALVTTALHPRDEVSVGWPSRLAKIGYGMAPWITERAVGMAFRRFLDRSPPAPARSGNLFTASTGRMTARGGWRKQREAGVSRSLATAGVLGLAGAGAVLLAKAMWSRRVA